MHLSRTYSLLSDINYMQADCMSVSYKYIRMYQTLICLVLVSWTPAHLFGLWAVASFGAIMLQYPNGVTLPRPSLTAAVPLVLCPYPTGAAPLIQGPLLVKTNRFGVQYWKPSFFSLRCVHTYILYVHTVC